MLSFQRFLSFVEVDQPVFSYKDVYTYQGVQAVLYTNDETHQDWVRRFLYATFDRREDPQDLLAISTDHCQVYSWVSLRTYTRLLEWVEEILLLRVGYFDDDIAEITFADGGMIFDRQRKVVLCYDQACQRIYYVSAGKDETVKYELTHTLGEYVASQLEEQGYYLLQASAVEKDGKSVLFCGGSGAGKTTILLGLLGQGYRLLADGKVFVGIVDRKIQTLAWPSAVGITLATTLHFDPLIGIYADLGSMAFPQHRIHSLALDRLEENEVDKIDLSVKETVSKFGAKYARDAELAQLFIIDEFLPYENFQPMSDLKQTILYLKQHFCYPTDAVTYDDWNAPTFRGWFQPRQKRSQTSLERFALTVRILANLKQVKKLNNDRYQSIDTKIDLIRKHL